MSPCPYRRLRHRRPPRRGFTLRQVFYWTAVLAVLMTLVIEYHRFGRWRSSVRLAISANGQRVAISFDDGSNVVCDTATGERLLEIRGGPVRGDERPIALSPDGKWLARAAVQFTDPKVKTGIEIWDISAGVRHEIAFPNRFGTLQFSPSGEYLAATSQQAMEPLSLFRFVPVARNTEAPHEGLNRPSAAGDLLQPVPVASASTQRSSTEAERNIQFKAFLPPGDRLLAFIDRTALGIYDIARGEWTQTQPITEPDLLETFRWSTTTVSPDGQHAVTFSALSQSTGPGPLTNVLDIDIAQLRITRRDELPADVYGAAFADNDTLVVLSYADAEIWDARTLLERTPIPDDNLVFDVAATPDGRTVVLAGLADLYRLHAGRLTEIASFGNSPILLLCLTFGFTLLLSWGGWVKARRARKQCDACGRTFDAGRPTDVLCPVCFEATLTPVELPVWRRRRLLRGLITWIPLFAIMLGITLWRAFSLSAQQSSLPILLNSILVLPLLTLILFINWRIGRRRLMMRRRADESGNCGVAAQATGETGGPPRAPGEPPNASAPVADASGSGL